MLTGKTKIYGHINTHTLYLSIPSAIVTDSKFKFKVGDEVSIVNHGDYIVLWKIKKRRCG